MTNASVSHRVNYDRVSTTTAFQKGLPRLRTGLAESTISLLCAEKKPLDCHRTILVSRYAKEFAETLHIHADGHLETQGEVEHRLLTRYNLAGGDPFRSPLISSTTPTRIAARKLPTSNNPLQTQFLIDVA